MPKIRLKLGQLIAVVAMAAIGYGAGVYFGDSDSNGLRRQISRWVDLMESAYSNQLNASLATRDGRSEYLIALSKDQSLTNHMAYIEAHQHIKYLSESIYPNTIRVALDVPVTQTVKDIEAQPFTRFVIKNYPFLFCH